MHPAWGLHLTVTTVGSPSSGQVGQQVPGSPWEHQPEGKKMRMAGGGCREQLAQGGRGEGSGGGRRGGPGAVEDSYGQRKEPTKREETEEEEERGCEGQEEKGKGQLT